MLCHTLVQTFDDIVAFTIGKESGISCNLSGSCIFCAVGFSFVQKALNERTSIHMYSCWSCLFLFCKIKQFNRESLFLTCYDGRLIRFQKISSVIQQACWIEYLANLAVFKVVKRLISSAHSLVRPVKNYHILMGLLKDDSHFWYEIFYMEF